MDFETKMLKLIFEGYEMFTPRGHSKVCCICRGRGTNCEIHDPHAHRLYILGGQMKIYTIIKRT